jgi:hypothetical protein
VTGDPHGGVERLPALVDDELSPELALVDPDVAERARDALPDITLTEIRLSLSLKVEQVPTPAVPQPVPERVAFVEPAPAPAPAPAIVRPIDSPAPPSYEEIRRVFHEPRIRPRRWRRSALAAVVVLGAAAGVALALPRALDGPSPKTSANSRSSGAPAAAAPTVHPPKSKGTSKAEPKAHKKANPSPTRHTRPHKTKSAPKKHAAAPPASAPTRHVSKRKHRAPAVRPHVRVLPDFVWAPVKNARGYVVVFLSGSKVALRVHTRAARLRVTTKQLHRGRYRWLVWRVGKSGSAIGKPLVDSNLRVR